MKYIDLTGEQIAEWIIAAPGRNRKAAAGTFGVSYAFVCQRLRNAGLSYVIGKTAYRDRAKRHSGTPLRRKAMQPAAGRKGKCARCGINKIAPGNWMLCEFCYRNHSSSWENAALP